MMATAPNKFPRTVAALIAAGIDANRVLGDSLDEDGYAYLPQDSPYPAQRTWPSPEVWDAVRQANIDDWSNRDAHGNT